jgi:hypothetical protein
MQQKQVTNINKGNPLLELPSDLLLYLASFLKDSDPKNPNASLLALGLVAKRLRLIKLEVIWNDLVRSSNRKGLIQFIKKQWFCPPSLNQTFFVELDSQTNGRLGVTRLIVHCHDVYRLLQFQHIIPTGQSQQNDARRVTRTNFKTTTAYHAYLLANPTDDYLESEEHWLEADEKGYTLSQVFTKTVTVFHALTFLEFKTYARLLDWMVEKRTILPLPSRVRENFETVAAYFEYLINHIHDLYITLRTNPGLINAQDEQGKTLLFHAVQAAKYLSKDRILWIVHILLATPNINVNLVDEEGDTFLHVATKHCADDKIFDPHESIIFDHIFVPFVEYAKKNCFNFLLLNKAGFAVIHLAAKIPSNENVWGFCGGPRESREFNPISKLSSNNDIDFNQLSGESCTALYYAIACSHRKHIHTMLSFCQFKTTAQRKVIQLLRDKITFMSQGLITKLQQYHASMGSTIVNELAWRAAYYRILKLVIIKITSLDYTQNLDLQWPTMSTITKVVTRFQEFISSNQLSPNSVNEATNRLISDLESVVAGNSRAETYDAYICNFLNGRNTSSPLFKIIIETVQEEAEQFIIDVNKMTEPFIETNPKPLTDYFKARSGNNSDKPEEDEKPRTSLNCGKS